jgi:serine phosphatase RsbU (regulator of sigma subunit)
LKKLVASAPNDTTKVGYLLSLAYKQSEKYTEEAAKNCEEALRLSQNAKYARGIADSYDLSAMMAFANGEYAKAIELNRKAIPYQIKMKDDFGLSRSYNNLGSIAYTTYNIDTCVHYFMLATTLAEKTNDTMAMQSLYSNLAVVLNEKKSIEKAVHFYDKALHLLRARKDRYEMAGVFVNLASMNISLKKDSLAFKYVDSALVIFREYKDTAHLIDVYANMANVYSHWKMYKEAAQVLELALNYSIQLKNEESITYCYVSLADTYRDLGKYDEAEKYFFMCIPLAKKMDLKKYEKSAYQNLAELYKLKNDFKKALFYNEQYIAIKDSMDKQVYSEKMLEVETKFDLQRKEQEIALLSKDKEVQEAELDKKKGWIGFFCVLVGAFAVLTVLIIRTNINRKKANKQLSQLNQDLHLSKNEVEKQKHIVEEKQKEIIDSINYAKRIQNTLLAHFDLLSHYIPSNFVLFKPKDIVSGDFYWGAEHHDKFYLAVCDSTGHGVPGAFMSLLNIGFLSEAIKERNILEPHLVFNYVRQRLIDGISKEGQKDGFDGVLLCIDHKTKRLTYAAAHNAPIIIRNGEIIELSKDKMPVGKGERTDSFTLFTIDHQPNDSLYLYTDGYADQFGGPKGKKFLYKRLVELLKTISPEDIARRGNSLNQKFEEWKGHLEQVDDVLVIGIKI